MKDRFESGLGELDDLLKDGYGYFANNAGKAIAVITVIIAALVTFTDVTFSAFGGQSFTTSLLVMLFSSYVIYFSLEKSGERLGEKSEEFRSALDRYLAVKAKISADDISALRDFCYEYSINEAEYRRKNYLAEAGLSTDEYERFKGGECLPGELRRRLRKCGRIKPYPLTPTLLLSKDGLLTASELKNPEAAKTFSLLLGLLPTTLSTFFTVSVMLTLKSSLTAETVIEGILKLSALPIIGFRGYSSGYFYVRGGKALWVETKARILEEFISTNQKSIKPV